MGMDTVELVMAIENEFQISIPNNIAGTLSRLRDLHGFVVQSLCDRGGQVDPTEVWNRLKRVVIEFSAVREELVVPDAHIVYDLGLD